MNLQHLRNWLELPDGRWPPDHYALLGLKPGEGSPEQVEERALDRMERLRRYQLPYPEEVTEGMNRLAQALDCLCDPEERRRYDTTLGLATVAVVAPPEPELPDVLELADEPDEPEPRPAPPPLLRRRPKSRPAPDNEAITLRDEAPPELPEAIGLERPRKRRRRGDEDPDRRERRKTYAELARLRKLLRAWLKVATHLTDPEEMYTSRTNAVALLNA